MSNTELNPLVNNFHTGDAEHKATTPPTKATKAQVGTVLAAITTGATAAATMLPSPWDGYVTGFVAVVGLVATFFGIFLPTNNPK